jgi:hypothetical protein
MENRKGAFFYLVFQAHNQQQASFIPVLGTPFVKDE